MAYLEDPPEPPITGRNFLKVLLVIVAVVIAFGFLFPPWQAERRYEAAARTSPEACVAARETAASYASFGFEETSREWHERAESDCLLSRSYRPD